MPEFLDILASPQALRLYLSSPATLWQIAILLAGLAAAWLTGHRLRRRLAPVIQPGALGELPRMAVRSGLLAIVPAILWLWLFAGIAVLRPLDMATDLLRPAMLLAGALALIRIGVFILRHSFSPGSRLKAWEGALTVTIWLLVALHILGWLPAVSQMLDEHAVQLGRLRISLYTVVSFALTMAILLFVALWLSTAVQWRVMKSQVLEDSLKIAITKLAKFTFLTLAVLAAMIAAGIDLTALAVFGGALGVGLGFGLQRIVSNFVSGVILAFEGSIRPGDVISVGETMGVVQTLHARHIVVHTRDGLDILVPNENLLTSQITNWSYGDRNVRLRLPVAISYGDDPERAIALLEEVARAHPRVLADPPPSACLLRFGDSGIELELRVWVNDPERGMGNVRSELNRAILRELKVAGITIPYPQRDVHIKDSTAPAARPNPGRRGNRKESARGRRRAPAAPAD